MTFLQNKCEKTYKDFGTGKDSTFHDVEIVSLVTLSDNKLACLLCHVLHRHQYDFKLLRIQAGEHEGLFETLLKGFLQLRSLRVDGGLEVALFVPGAEDLGTDGSSRALLLFVLKHIRQVVYVLVFV